VYFCAAPACVVEEVVAALEAGAELPALQAVGWALAGPEAACSLADISPAPAIA
jgi:hypothetical protein